MRGDAIIHKSSGHWSCCGCRGSCSVAVVAVIAGSTSETTLLLLMIPGLTETHFCLLRHRGRALPIRRKGSEQAIGRGAMGVH